MIAGTRSSSFGYSEAAIPHSSALRRGASDSVPMSPSPTMSPANRPFPAPAIAGLDALVCGVTASVVVPARAGAPLQSLEHRDPVAVVLGDLARLHQQVEVTEHLREGEVGLCDRHVPPHLDRDLVGGERPRV